jgi:hypothetical protein
MGKNIDIAYPLVDLTDEELDAVAGGFFNSSFIDFVSGGHAAGRSISAARISVGNGGNANGGRSGDPSVARGGAANGGFNI